MRQYYEKYVKSFMAFGEMTITEAKSDARQIVRTIIQDGIDSWKDNYSKEDFGEFTEDEINMIDKYVSKLAYILQKETDEVTL